MGFNQQLTLELIKLGLTFLAVVVAGGGLTAYWAARQKRREIELLELSKFYEYYGSFLSVLRMWNVSKNYQSIGTPPTTHWILLEQATETEGGIESMLVRLATERKLTEQDRQKLGKFRQSFQTLRESIREDEIIEWAPSDHPEYRAYKEGACYLAGLLVKKGWWQRPTQKQAAEALLEITSSKWEPEQRRGFA